MEDLWGVFLKEMWIFVGRGVVQESLLNFEVWDLKYKFPKFPVQIKKILMRGCGNCRISPNLGVLNLSEGIRCTSNVHSITQPKSVNSKRA